MQTAQSCMIAPSQICWIANGICYCTCTLCVISLDKKISRQPDEWNSQNLLDRDDIIGKSYSVRRQISDLGGKGQRSGR